MQRDLIVKGRSLGGSSDLTLLAPIKPGFVESLESVTYKTRIKRVLETLHGARMAAHEHHTARLLSDAVERVGAIHSVRVAVLEPEDKVLLAVTFDGSWESYIRVLWDKVGTLLDLIFCGTVDYVTAYDHTFDEWLEWARRVQVETGFFYGPAESTARDVNYYRRVERMRLRGATTELDEMRSVSPSAEAAVQRTIALKSSPPDDPPPPESAKVTEPRMVRERIRHGLRGLASLYRLTDLHRPFTADGIVLRRAALDLLREFVQMHDARLGTDQLTEAKDVRFQRQLEWLFPDWLNPSKPAFVPRDTPPAPQEEVIRDEVLMEIQGGIVRPYEGITHGVILMLAFDDVAGAQAFFAWLQGRITHGAQIHIARKKDDIFRNIALTPAGLRAAGIGEDELELFPEEFRQGMAARAGSIGDVRNNHPRRWRLPGQFVGLDSPPGNIGIEMDAVHAVLQLRCTSVSGKIRAATELFEPLHPLRDEVKKVLARRSVRLLAVQSLKRSDAAKPDSKVKEHFGYEDGNGQPDVEWKGKPSNRRNRIHLGEIVHGYDNAADPALNLSNTMIAEAAKARAKWLANGSFLVMRKYRQFVGRLENAIEATVNEMPPLTRQSPQALREIVYAKLMGRSRDGQPLVPGPGKNNFLYTSDPQGKLCPLHAHIRLAHPRFEKGSAARIPRLMRRGMSYGPRYMKDKSGDDVDRGLIFMAYNASIGEQYEVIQRWLNGGNSTGSSSGQSCPIVGVPENGVRRNFRFEIETKNEVPKDLVFRVALEPNTPLFEEPEVLTRLEWGMYLFTPSLSVLDRLRNIAASVATAAPAAMVPWQASRGRKMIAAINHIQAERGEAAAADAWKAAIEDPESIDRLDSASLWAAIRQDHHGVMKTPYGTLVASRELLSQVLLDPHERYSVSGQYKRMERSFGGVALGLDAGEEYERQSEPINRAIAELTISPKGKDQVFKIAFDAAARKIHAIVDEAIVQSKKVCDPRFEVGFDVREVVDEVLADLSEAWFGLQGSSHFRRGSADWTWKDGEPPLYPGHFTALSRYMFQPNPGAAPTELGEIYGQSLRRAMNQFVAAHRPADPSRFTVPNAPDGSPAPIATATFNHPDHGKDNDFVARTMVGVLMGFNPTIIGAVLNVIREWQREGRFGALRSQVVALDDPRQAREILAPPMAAAARMRPMPQIGWRTARCAHRLGPAGTDGLDVDVGDKIVLAMASGTQQSLADGQYDGRLMFGGVRTATKPDPTRVKPHPTHACPGYEAGIQAMLGTLAALLMTRKETMRQGVAPLTFTVEGRVDLSGLPNCAAKAGIGSQSKKRRAGGARTSAGSPMVRPSGRKGLILAWGDSWLDYRENQSNANLGTDLRDCLELFGYLVPDNFCVWTRWLTAEVMAANPQPFLDFTTDQLENTPVPLAAILISAGGNDYSGRKLKDMLLPKSAGPTPFDHDKFEECMGKLRGQYVTMISEIKATLDRGNTKDVPIILHGYDHPFPTGRGSPTWLFEPFKERGYDLTQQADKDAAAGAMVTLIDRFNAMLADIAGDSKFKRFVRHVNLTGTIAGYWPSGKAIEGWDNDLHPTSKAFELLAMKLDSAIAPQPDRRAAKAAARTRARARGAKASASPRKPRQPAL